MELRQPTLFAALAYIRVRVALLDQRLKLLT